MLLLFYQIAYECHGYVGADLESFCFKAAMHKIREQIAALDYDAKTIDVEKLASIEVIMDNFNVKFIVVISVLLYCCCNKYCFNDKGKVC